ncbi:bacteriophage T4 gp5 trimerisation domain-containing protein, partial [Vibrio sp. LaRot3]|uniref:bacteriophage T4 gp5 trimerisation domain-containing protein n=1 Tax=Vibrio sp. LaRot3 TaxID=2998829 RepID=UPI0022D5525C|nr:type VI secretion system tip protein VgrG [Vibrio sp. LaRot3]
NDHTTHIKHDKHLTVDNDSFALVKNNQHTIVKGEDRTKVTKDTTQVVNGSLNQKIGTNYALQSGTEIHLKSGHKLVMEAGSEITIKAGGSFVKVDPAGVHIVGPTINLNAGGSPGSGSGYGGNEAIAPRIVEELVAPEELVLAKSTPKLIQQVQADVRTEMPVTTICPNHTGEDCPNCSCPCEEG